MNNPMKVLMLGVVMFALTSVAAPVDHTDGRADGVATELAPRAPIPAPATADRTQGFGAAITGLVLTEPVAAQEAYPQTLDCTDYEKCPCYCLKDPDEEEPEWYGEYCHEAEDPDHAPPRWDWIVEDRVGHCSTTNLTNGDCSGHGPGVEECSTCHHFDCGSGNGGGNGGNGGGNGGALAAVPFAPSGVVVLESPAPVVAVGTLVRDRCRGWVVGVVAGSAGLARLVL